MESSSGGGSTGGHGGRAAVSGEPPFRCKRHRRNADNPGFEQSIGKSPWPCGPPPRMKGFSLTTGWLLFKIAITKRNGRMLTMVATTPLGKWSGRRYHKNLAAGRAEGVDFIFLGSWAKL